MICNIPFQYTIAYKEPRCRRTTNKVITETAPVLIEEITDKDAPIVAKVSARHHIDHTWVQRDDTYRLWNAGFYRCDFVARNVSFETFNANDLVCGDRGDGYEYNRGVQRNTSPLVKVFGDAIIAEYGSRVSLMGLEKARCMSDDHDERMAGMQRRGAELVFIDGALWNKVPEPVLAVTAGHNSAVKCIGADEVGDNSEEHLQSYYRLSEWETVKDMGKTRPSYVEIICPEAFTYKSDIRPFLVARVAHLVEEMRSEVYKLDMAHFLAYMDLRDLVLTARKDDSTYSSRKFEALPIEDINFEGVVTALGALSRNAPAVFTPAEAKSVRANWERNHGPIYSEEDNEAIGKLIAFPKKKRKQKKAA